MPKEAKQGEVEQKEDKKLSKHDFYFETPLYKEISIENIEEDILEGETDGYSQKNHIDTTYKIDCDYRINIDKKYIHYYGYTSNYKGFFQSKLSCKRKDNDILIFYMLSYSGKIVKVGQYPSLADIQFAELGKKYNGVLIDEDLKNLKKAIGLESHGIGAGSFVYLRRIFENLVFETYNQNKEKLNLTEAEFITKRMSDKIEDIKDYLPTQLVEMKNVYSILSKGVHELSEQDCLKFFSAIKLSIVLILDQKIKMKEEKEKEERVKKEIASITKLIS